MTPNSGSVMINLEQSLTMALVCQNYMTCADVYYFTLKTMLKTHSYFQLLAVKAAIVEDAKTFAKYLSPVRQQFIV